MQWECEDGNSAAWDCAALKWLEKQHAFGAAGQKTSISWMASDFIIMDWKWRHCHNAKKGVDTYQVHGKTSLLKFWEEYLIRQLVLNSLINETFQNVRVNYGDRMFS